MPINQKILYGIQNKLVVRVGCGLFCPLYYSEAATASISCRIPPRGSATNKNDKAGYY